MTDRPTALARTGALRTLVYAASLGTLVAAHLPPLLGGKLANIDEGYAMALASRLLEGRHLYVGAVSQRGPLMYAVYEGLAGTFGWTSVTAVRLASLAFSLAIVALVGRGARTPERPLAVLGATYALALGFDPYDGLALNAELMLLPFLVLAALVTVRAGHRGALWAALAGLFYGVATCFKQPAIVCVVPAAAFLTLRAHSWREGAGRVASLAAGAALVPLLFVVHAAARGDLAAFWYQTVTYNLTIHRAGAVPPLEWTRTLGRLAQAPLLACSLVAGLAVASARASQVRRRLRRRGLLVGLGTVDAFFVALALANLLAAAAYRQRFGHYFLPAMPFLVLCAARALVGSGHRRALSWGVPVAALLCFGASSERMFEVLGTADGRVAHGESVEHLARYVQRTTSPADRVFVWGFSPSVYPYAHRRPATRFLFESYVTGFVPWLYDDAALEPGRVVPGSMVELLDDLEREAPAVIVDAGSV
ncbi:MAG TPA: glycosyltransferase family 39 protein, partial [Polyangiaceae bacterium]